MSSLFHKRTISLVPRNFRSLRMPSASVSRHSSLVGRFSSRSAAVAFGGANGAAFRRRLALLGVSCGGLVLGGMGLELTLSGSRPAMAQPTVEAGGRKEEVKKVQNVLEEKQEYEEATPLDRFKCWLMDGAGYTSVFVLSGVLAYSVHTMLIGLTLPGVVLVAFFDYGRRSFGEWYLGFKVLVKKDNSRPSIERMILRFCVEQFVTASSAAILPLVVLWRTNRSPADLLVGTYLAKGYEKR